MSRLYWFPVLQCAVEGCKAEAEYMIPAMFCDEHWHLWWNMEEDDTQEGIRRLLKGEHA